MLPMQLLRPGIGIATALSHQTTLPRSSTSPTLLSVSTVQTNSNVVLPLLNRQPK
jgi:hypothetical protein